MLALWLLHTFLDSSYPGKGSFAFSFLSPPPPPLPTLLLVTVLCGELLLIPRDGSQYW